MLHNTSVDLIGANIILSTVECGTHFADPDTTLVFNISYEIFGGGTHLAKAFQYAGLSLVGPSSSFWIGSHIGRDNSLAIRTPPNPGLPQ